jgi:hypothetical protein
MRFQREGLKSIDAELQLQTRCTRDVIVAERARARSTVDETTGRVEFVDH